MSDQEYIRHVLEEQFNSTSGLLLYKDKQLLKGGQYDAFAREQQKKARTIVWANAFGIFMAICWGILSLIEYGARPNVLDLVIGLSGIAGSLALVFFTAKEYYTINSSMKMFLKVHNSTPSRKHDSPASSSVVTSQ